MRYGYRYLDGVTSRLRGAGSISCLLLAVMLVGCVLPAQQLSLPGTLDGSAASDIETGSTGARQSGTRRGVPLSDRASEGSREPQIVRGTGSFVGQVQATDPGVADPKGASRRPNGRTGAVETQDGVTLNVAGASIAEVARSVLGDVLGLNYSVGEGVKGVITLQTTRPIPRSELLGVFEALIRAEGAAIVVESGVYRIVPSASAGPGPLRTRSVGGLESTIISLRYVAAEEMQRILSALAPQSAIVRVEQSRNVLIASGTAAELTSIRDTVNTFDVDWMRGMSFGIFPVESGDPEAIAQELDIIFANDRQSPTKGLVRFVPNRRLKAVLVMTSKPAMITQAGQWVRRLDKVGQENEKQVFVYHVQNRPAGELAALLQRVYAPAGQRLGDPRAPIAPGAAPVTLSSDAAGLGSGLPPTGTIAGEPRPIIPPFTPFPVPVQPIPAPGSPVPGAPAADQAAPQSQTVQATGPSVPDDRTSGIQVVSYEGNNSLVITATKSEYQRIRKILSRIDLAPPQVLLEATIAEVTLNDSLRFGLRWFFEGGPNRFTLTDAATGVVASRFPGFSYFLNTPNIQIALNALSDITDVNIVSSPSLTVLDNKKAVLQVGDEVPVATQSAVSVISPGAPIVNSVTFRNTGVILGITPRISENGRVLLDIEQEVSDVTPTTSSGIDSPTIRQRRIKTTVAVNTGETIVLAGFMQDRASKGRQQVPILGNVPLVGTLFKDKNDEIRRTELLIAITPQVITDNQQIRGIAAEFRDRINLTTRPQRQAPPDRHEQIDRVFVR